MANLEFYRTLLRSPAGTRYLVDGGDFDASDQPYVWLRPVDKQDRPIRGARRRRLRRADSAGWTVLGPDPAPTAGPR